MAAHPRLQIGLPAGTVGFAVCYSFPCSLRRLTQSSLTTPRERATIVLTLDVSRSMLAEDVSPNRLDAAKAAAQDFLTMLPPGFNVSLVSFAAYATILVPPTLDRATVSAAIDNLEAIADVEGVDGVFIGPADLSASMGHRGNPGHPEMVALFEQATRRIVATGKAAGTLAVDEAMARRYLDWGATFVAVGLDTVTLARETTRLAKLFKGQA